MGILRVLDVRLEISTNNQSIKQEDDNFYECKIKGKLRLSESSSTNPCA